jgi:hypothetical protein
MLELRTTGFSMAPLILEDSIVDVVFDDPSSTRPGDLVLFARGDSLVLHRVIHRWNTEKGVQFREKGDHKVEATVIDEEDVLARVVAVRRGERRTVFDTAGGRAASKVLLGWSRMEWRLYQVKRKLFGSDPTRLGKMWSALSRGVRKAATRSDSH